MWQNYRTYISYLSIVYGVLIIITSIYDSESWEDLRSNYLGFILGFGFIHVYYKQIKSQKTDK